LAKAENAADTETLRTTAGLSRAKCDCIVAIAMSFRDGFLSEELLMPPNDDSNKNESNDEEVRAKLLSIKGLGPWSVDMFLMFRCHRSNVLPIGDLAVRNGTGALWKVSGHARDKSLCAKKDASTIATLHAPFEPYRSVSSYYMYKVVGDANKTKKKKAVTTKKKKQPASKKTSKDKKN
jgi:DNA-3-methyladenine glycosylase II